MLISDFPGIRFSFISVSFSVLCSFGIFCAQVLAENMVIMEHSALSTATAEVLESILHVPRGSRAANEDLTQLFLAGSGTGSTSGWGSGSGLCMPLYE